LNEGEQTEKNKCKSKGRRGTYSHAA